MTASPILAPGVDYSGPFISLSCASLRPDFTVVNMRGWTATSGPHAARYTYRPNCGLARVVCPVFRRLYQDTVIPGHKAHLMFRRVVAKALHADLAHSESRA